MLEQNIFIIETDVFCVMSNPTTIPIKITVVHIGDNFCLSLLLAFVALQRTQFRLRRVGSLKQGNEKVKDSVYSVNQWADPWGKTCRAGVFALRSPCARPRLAPGRPACRG